jgi:4-alpha-glucanotransferase
MIPAVLERRRAGVLAPHSLPGGIGNGDLGADAHRFVDFLAQAGFSVWQMLPLGRRTARFTLSFVVVARRNPMLISLERLVEWDWLDAAKPAGSENPVGYRLKRLAQAHRIFTQRASVSDQQVFEAFINAEAYWLDDYALYRVLRREYSGRAWYQWPAPLRDREPQALEEARVRFIDEIAQVFFEQFACPPMAGIAGACQRTSCAAVWRHANFCGTRQRGCLDPA